MALKNYYKKNNDAVVITDRKFGSRCLLVSILFLLVFSSVSMALGSDNLNDMRIASIEVAGNRSITSSAVLSRVRSRVGDLFSEEIAAEDVQRIAQLDAVQQSYYNTTVVDGQVRLTFIAIEYNVVRSIEFFGNKKFKSDALVKKLEYKKADYLDVSLVEAGRETIEEHYKSKGYAFVVVKVEYEQLSQGKVIYSITEGPRPVISSIEYKGNAEISKGKLKKFAKLKKKKMMFWSSYYTKENIDREIANFTKEYYKRGYLNISINVEEQFNADKSKVDLIFRLSEGAAYTVRKVDVVGNQHFTSEQLMANVKVKEDKVFNKTRGDNDTEKIKKDYLETGFVEAKVEQDYKFVTNDRVQVDYVVTEGQRFRVGEIEIAGNDVTQDRVIRRILDEYNFTPGQWYNADIAKGDGTGYLEQMIKSTAFTESATITPVEGPNGVRNAIVNIKEGQTGMIMFGAGVSTSSGVIGQLMISENNFDIKNKPKSFHEFLTGKAYKGAGQRFRISLEPGTVVSRYSVSFTEPYLNDRPISMSLGGSSWQRGWEAYDEQRIKGFIGFEKRYPDRWRRSIDIRAESVDVGGLDWDTPKEIREDKGQHLLVGARVGISRKMTNNVFKPSEGYLLSFGVEPVFGDSSFGVVDGSFQKFYTLHEDIDQRKTILSAKVTGAAILGGEAPVFERFYAGGSGTEFPLRGFEYRGVSKKGKPYVFGDDDNNAGTPDAWYSPPGAKKKDPIGSDFVVVGNVELNIPLVSDNISWLLFVDGGLIDEGGIRASVGTGVEIKIPQFLGTEVPMRFEIATPFMKGSDDDTQFFSFSLGKLY